MLLLLVTVEDMVRHVILFHGIVVTSTQAAACRRRVEDLLLSRDADAAQPSNIIRVKDLVSPGACHLFSRDMD